MANRINCETRMIAARKAMLRAADALDSYAQSITDASARKAAEQKIRTAMGNVSKAIDRMTVPQCRDQLPEPNGDSQKMTDEQFRTEWARDILARSVKEMQYAVFHQLRLDEFIPAYQKNKYTDVPVVSE